MYVVEIKPKRSIKCYLVFLFKSEDYVEFYGVAYQEFSNFCYNLCGSPFNAVLWKVVGKEKPSQTLPPCSRGKTSWK